MNVEQNRTPAMRATEPESNCEEVASMRTSACSRLSSYFPRSTSRSAPHGTNGFLNWTVALLALLIPGSSAFGQATLTPTTLSFGTHIEAQSSAAKTATFKNTG